LAQSLLCPVYRATLTGGGDGRSQNFTVTDLPVVAHSNSEALQFSTVPRQKPERQFKVGDRVTVNLHTGRLVDATVKAVISQTDGVRLQVDYGKDETALVHLWQVHPSDS
jgi:hypothetical protein